MTQMHARTMATQKAHLDVSEAVCKAVETHGLTYGELQGILAQIQMSWARWQVRDERGTT